jgi:hypothetical protein
VNKGVTAWAAGAANAALTMPWNTWSYLIDWSQQTLTRPVFHLPRITLVPNPFASEGSYDYSYLIGEVAGPQILVGEGIFAARAATLADDFGIAATRAGSVADNTAAGALAGGKVIDDVLPFRANADHIFRSSPGHLPADSADSRAIIRGAVAPEFLVSTKPLLPHGELQTYRRVLEDGSQSWAEVNDGVITNGGLNVGFRR